MNTIVEAPFKVFVLFMVGPRLVHLSFAFLVLPFIVLAYGIARNFMFFMVRILPV
jgi:hypothetical protein